jgi:hypothetical protein
LPERYGVLGDYVLDGFLKQQAFLGFQGSLYRGAAD